MTLPFGLLHGPGFAGAPAEIGLPQAEIPPALLAFNPGIELGQSALVLLAGGLAIARPRSRPALHPQRVRSTTAYAMGSLAAFWIFERVPAAAAPLP